MFSSVTGGRNDVEQAQRKLADEVNSVIVELKPSGQVDAIKDMRFMLIAWRDPSRSKDPTTGKLSCFGKIITDNAVKYIDKAGNVRNCWMLMAENYNPTGIWVPTDKIRALMTGADGKNSSLSKDDGSFHSFQNALKNAGKLAGAALGEGVTMDLSLGDDDLVDYGFCFWQVAFFEMEENDDAELETYQEVVSYGSGSGAEVAAILMTGQGTSVKLLDGGYGGRTKVRPSLDVDGVRHEFNLSVTAMLDEHGKSVEVKKSGTESKQSAMRAAGKGLAVEVPVGFGPKKISSSIVALCPIEKHAAPYKPLSSFVYTPPVYVAPTALPTIYLTIDPVSKMGVYSRKWTNGVFHRYNIDYCASAISMGAPLSTQIVGYKPAAYAVFQPTHVQTMGVVAPGFTVVPNGPIAIVAAGHYEPAPVYRGLSSKTPHYRSLSAKATSSGAKYCSMGAAAAAVAGPADCSDEEEEEDDDSSLQYRSMGAPAPAPAPEAEMEEEEPAAPVFRSGSSVAVDDEEPVDVGDAAAAAAALTTDEAVVVDVPPPDTSNDAAIASAVQAEEDKAAVPPALGDKRTLSEADMRPPETNMFLTRQSRAKKSAGRATKIVKDVKRGKEGSIMISETIYVGIKPGTKPTRADIIAVNKLVQERMDAAKALGGKEKTLDSKYSEVQGATSSAPMSLSTKCDIAATQAALVQAPIVGVPVGLF